MPTRYAFLESRPRTGETNAAVFSEDRLEHAIIQRINTDRYNLWFRGHTKFFLRDDALIVGVPNLMCQEWLQKTFGDDIRDAVRSTAGPEVAVRFVIDPELFRAARAEQELVRQQDVAPIVPPAAAGGTSENRPQRNKEGKPRTPRRFRSLAEFVVGSCNRVAHASALGVVDEPGIGVNPLVLYGPVGTGKTHLLEGVYGGLRRRWPELALRFVTAEDFTNCFVQAMHHGRQAAFRKQFRDCSVLLIDDLNFLAGKKGTQVEFLHTFDALAAEHKQIVISTDCHPRLSEELLPELVDRLLGGAVWSLLPPDTGTRLDILRAKAARSIQVPQHAQADQAAQASRPGRLIPEEVLIFVAGQLRGNVRELEGAIHSLNHFSKVANRPVDLALAREALGDLLRHAVRAVGLRDVDGAVCSVLGLPAGTLLAKKRAWAVSHPRMIAISLCRKHTAATYGEISSFFGNRNHSTAVAAEKKVRAWLESNQSLKIGEREWRVRDLVERVEREMGR